MHTLVFLPSVFALLFWLLSTFSAASSTFVVTKTADTNDGICDSDCSLREAVTAANANVNPSSITFDPAVFGTPQTITLLSGQLVIADNRRVSIAGPSADLVTISGNHSSRIFRMLRDTVVDISGVKLINGNGTGGGFGDKEGGAIYVEPNGTGTLLTITDSVMSGNSAAIGGALRLNGNVVVNILSSDVSGNAATGNPGGGGIYSYNSVLTIQNSTVNNNTANYQFGFYGAIGTDGVFGSLTIRDSVIDGNSSTNTGGIGIGVPANISNTTVSNNSSAGINVNAVTTITGSTISGNTGGGIFVNRFLTITNSTISGNSGGGGISGGENFVISDSTLSNNTATNSGGAVHNTRFNNLPGATPLPTRMTNCIVSGNSAGSFGGAIYNDGRLEIEDSTLQGNTAGSGGGAAFNVVVPSFTPGNLTLTRSAIFGNRSNASGGAFQNQGGVINLVNSTVSSNAAPIGGGTAALMTQNGTLNLSFSTIAFNSGTGAAVRISGGAGTVNAGNTIIARNISRNAGPDFFGQLTSQGFNLIGNTTNATITGNTTGNILNTDPRLVPYLRNNGGPTSTHALQPNSPAVDAGNSPMMLLTDQRGRARPFDFPGVPNQPDGNGADIGAFERQPDDLSLFVQPFFDFDGDGQSDLSVFRPSVGEWYYYRRSNGSVFGAQFGASTDHPVPGDFTGDGKTDIAFWRPSTGEWFVLRSENSTYFAFPFGSTNDIPRPADFDSDGKTDAAVYRPSQSTWYILRSSDGGVTSAQFGISSDVPVPADYDGDGKADIAIWRSGPGQWWILRSSNGTVFAATFGSSTDKPVPGDYTGDGKADVAFYRPSEGNWYVLRSEDSSYYAFPFGISTDKPVPADYDGDGLFDPAVFRPSDTNWYILRSTGGVQIQPFGLASDVPLPGPFVP